MTSSKWYPWVTNFHGHLDWTVSHRMRDSMQSSSQVAQAAGYIGEKVSDRDGHSKKVKLYFSCEVFLAGCGKISFGSIGCCRHVIQNNIN